MRRLLTNGSGVLVVGSQLQEFLVSFAGGVLVLQFRLRLREPEKRFRQRGIPFGRFRKALGGGVVIALFEIEIADAELLLRAQRIESVYLGFVRGVFFRRFRHLGFGIRGRFLGPFLELCG